MGVIGGRIVLSKLIGCEYAVGVFIPRLFVEVIRANNSPGGFPWTLRWGLAIPDPDSNLVQQRKDEDEDKDENLGELLSVGVVQLSVAAAGTRAQTFFSRLPPAC